MNLFIEKLTLKNWGPFHEKENVEFSLDGTKNVTYILGKNSTGKTIIFDAIYWCLFNIPKIDDLKTIVNKVALKINEKDMFVRLKFYTIDDYGNRTDYDAKRSLEFSTTFTKEKGVIPEMPQMSFNANKYAQTSSQPRPISQEDFQKLMDHYIPEGPRPYFFLDGERLADLFKKENLQKIESYANAISDIFLIDQVSEKLAETYDSLKETLSKASGLDKKIIEENEKLEKIKDKKEKLEKRKEELKTKLGQKVELEKTLKKKCSLYEELKPRLDRIKKFEDEKSILESNYKIKYEEFSNLLKETLPILYLEDKMKWCYQDLDRLKKEGKIPTSKIPLALIKEILQIKHECICGRKLDEYTEKRFKELLKSLPIEDKFNDTVNTFWFKLNDTLQKVDQAKSSLEKKLTKIRKINLEINKLKNKISDEKKYITLGEDFENMHEKLKRWGEVKEEIGDSQSQLGNIENAMVSIKYDYKKQQRKLESRVKKDKKMKNVGKKLDFVRAAKEIIENVKDYVKETIIEHTQKHTSEGFCQLIWDPANWKDIEIGNDWSFTAITSNDYRLPCHSLSAGQRHVLGIAFMSSLGKVTGNLIPFIFDSPFGRISEDPIEKIGKKFPDLMRGRQVVLFVTDTEDKNIRPHIKNIIGKKYVLDKISGTEAKIRGG